MIQELLELSRRDLVIATRPIGSAHNISTVTTGRYDNVRLAYFHCNLLACRFRLPLIVAMRLKSRVVIWTHDVCVTKEVSAIVLRLMQVLLQRRTMRSLHVMTSAEVHIELRRVRCIFEV